MWSRATLRSWGRPTHPSLKLALDFKRDERSCVRTLFTVRDANVQDDGTRKRFGPRHRLARDILSPESMTCQRILQNRDTRSSFVSSFAPTEVDMEADEVVVDAEVEEHEAAVERNIVGDGVCAAYCTHAPVPLRALARYFSRPITLDTPRGRVYSRPGETLTDAADVLRVPLVTQNNTARVGSGMRGFPGPTQEAHAFFFRSGAVVFWGVPMSARRELFQRASLLASETEGAAGCPEDATHGTPPWTGDTRAEAFRRNLCDGIDSLSLATRSPPARMEDFEHEFEYFLDAARRDGRATFKNDRIYIPDLSNTDEVLALSYGLAQSVKLHMSEVALDALVQRTAVLPQELAEHGRISLSATMIRKLIGELLTARYSVNLVSDILDTPDYFWQHPELERLHLECVNAVELKQRSRILNARAEVINDTLHMLKGELAAATSMRLERAILFLIWIEVLFEVARFSGITAH